MHTVCTVVSLHRGEGGHPHTHAPAHADPEEPTVPLEVETMQTQLLCLRQKGEILGFPSSPTWILFLFFQRTANVYTDADSSKIISFIRSAAARPVHIHRKIAMRGAAFWKNSLKQTLGGRGRGGHCASPPFSNQNHKRLVHLC